MSQKNALMDIMYFFISCNIAHNGYEEVSTLFNEIGL